VSLRDLATRCAVPLVFAFTALGARGAAAQPGKVVTVAGLAFDSLRNRPLAGAFVTIAEQSRSTTSDAKGKFVFEKLPPGTYTFAMQHAVFDSLGLSGASARATVTDGKAVITLSVPSFATMWRALCGGIPVPTNDSGLVYGSVRDARKGLPMPEATVELSWLDLVNTGTKLSANVTQRRWKNEVQADARGDYAVCGVPIETQSRLRANYLKNATGILDLPSSGDRVRRRDLVVPGISPSDTVLKGSISGTVNDDNGKPLAGVRVILDEKTEVRTAADGRFSIANAAAGSRQLDFAAVGMTPISMIVDVMVNQPAMASATLRTVSNLEAMRVTATGSLRRSAQQFMERRKLGFGSFVDSTAIGSRGTMASVFYTMPGVTVQRQPGSNNARLFALFLPSTGQGQCLATLYFDGVLQQDQEILTTLTPEEIAGIEVYQQRLTVPTEFLNKNPMCGVVVVWTKHAFRR
jgi:hypothetical protein